eukprot:scaffold1293_cov375-Prasinococcus_capsulatus_cf.AAC.21
MLPARRAAWPLGGKKARPQLTCIRGRVSHPAASLFALYPNGNGTPLLSFSPPYLRHRRQKTGLERSESRASHCPKSVDGIQVEELLLRGCRGGRCTQQSLALRSTPTI